LVIPKKTNVGTYSFKIEAEITDKNGISHKVGKLFTNYQVLKANFPDNTKINLDRSYLEYNSSAQTANFGLTKPSIPDDITITSNFASNNLPKN
jgi:hypothetical protein